MNINLLFNIEDWLIGLGIAPDMAVILNTAFSIGILLLMAYLYYIIVKRIILRTLTLIAKRRKARWDYIMNKKKIL